MKLSTFRICDFLYFVSSSAIKRFKDTPEFEKLFYGIDLTKAIKEPYKLIHKNLLEAFKNSLPDDSNLELFPFTIKKKANIYGIIFGSKNLKGVEKFLTVAWNENKINGSANFDIDEELSKNQLELFEAQPLRKIELFEKNLEEYLRKKVNTTNKEIYIKTLKEGHKTSHATQKLKDLKKKGYINFEGSGPKINYNCIKDSKNIIEIIWLK
jgi:hypothetical protein